MEAAATGVVAVSGRAVGVAVPVPAPAKKKWRAVSNAGIEELDHSKLGPSDERTIYELGRQGTGEIEVDFSSLTLNGGMDAGLLQQRLHDVSRQREELEHMEIELRAQVISRTEILEMQKNFNAQINEHVSNAAILKEQLQEREQCIHELEGKLEEKERELHAIKIDNEAAWAKEDLLREQNRELATYRRERDNSEAERSQHLQQIHDLKEHIHEKESQFIELEEQHRVAQETILYKDEQLREAQAWVARVQEMDALQSTTNHSLQAELRERTEQLNQLWLGWQRQVIEMERVHVQTVQQLRLELAEIRERSGIYTDDSHAGHTNSADVSSHVQNDGNQFNVNENGSRNGNSVIQPNGEVDKSQPLVSGGSTAAQTEHVSGVPIHPSSILGIGGFLPPGQMTGLHPYIMQQHGIPQSVTSANSHIPQSHMGHYPPSPAIMSQQPWPNQQVVEDGSQMSHQNEYQRSETDESNTKADAHNYELLAFKESGRPVFLETQLSSQRQSGSVVVSSDAVTQVYELNNKQFLYQDAHQNLENGPLPSNATLISDGAEFKPEHEVISFRQEAENTVEVINPSREEQNYVSELPLPDITNVTATSTKQGRVPDPVKNDISNSVLSEGPVIGRASNPVLPGKAQLPVILDERSLLSCIVRAIPAGSGGQIRISTTLPNRLGKMLAPLHWHDYRKQYGKLDEFLARHPELFVIEGDFVYLREGAQKIISATTAAAKVAAAAAAAVSSPYSSMVPSVAVTPVAPPHRLKLVSSSSNQSDSSENMQEQQSNGFCFSSAQGPSNVKILSKPKNVQEQNGLSSEVRSSHSSVHMVASNGLNNERGGTNFIQNKVSSNGRHGLSYGGKMQGRVNGAGVTARR